MLQAFHLAELLHKTVGEIMQMDTWEFSAWGSFFALKDEESKKRQPS